MLYCGHVDVDWSPLVHVLCVICDGFVVLPGCVWRSRVMIFSFLVFYWRRMLIYIYIYS